MTARGVKLELATSDLHRDLYIMPYPCPQLECLEEEIETLRVVIYLTAIQS
jgi:hypothetical protein